MKNITILICLLVAVVFNAKLYSQEEGSTYKAKLLFKASYGLNVPFNNMDQNRETDYLIDYNDKPQMIPSLSALFFIRKRLGVELNLKFTTLKDNAKAEESFRQFADNQYSENYFVNASAPSYSLHDPVVTFGIVYRLETDKMYLHPKLAFGGTTIDLNRGEIQLKEKNTNNGYTVSYSGGAYKSLFTVSPSVSAGYKLTKRFWVDLNINVSYFKSEFTYDKKFTNLHTKQVQTENIAYKKNMFDTYISLGIVYVAARKK